MPFVFDNPNHHGSGFYFDDPSETSSGSGGGDGFSGDLGVNMTAQSLLVKQNWTKAGNAYEGDNPEGTVIDPTTYPRATLSDITGTGKYQGAFKLPQSSVRYSKGTMAIVDGGSSFFMTGNKTVTANSIREFSVPALVNEDTDVSLLNTATQLQASGNLSTGTTGTPDNTTFEQIEGLVYKDGTLYGNNYMGYDNGNHKGLSFTVAGLNDLSTATVKGLMAVDVSHGKMAASLSPIPNEWQSILGGDLLLSDGQEKSITSRLSNGPSVFTLSSTDIITANAGDSLTTGKFADFPTSNRLVADFLNYEGSVGRVNNDLWTELSAVGFTFVVPGTRTIAVIGRSAGHMSEGSNPLSFTTGAAADLGAFTVVESGIAAVSPYAGTRSDNGVNSGNINGSIAYKDTLDTWVDSEGEKLGGYRVYNDHDNSAYYWLYDINDLVGLTNLYDAMPYDYGRFPTPFAKDNGNTDASDNAGVYGGSIDPTTNKLYLSIAKANNSVDPKFRGDPVVAVYQLGGN
jgi:hypothetical protein